LPEKVEGAEMTCRSCGTDLICRMKEYKGDYEPKLQWQNEDGTAHYNTKDGKNFTCNIQDDDAEEFFPPKPTLDIPETDEITASHIDKQLILISQIEKKVISYLEKDVAPAKIGLYVKLIYDGIVRQ